MSGRDTPAEPAPSPAVPPASRLGSVLGWVLPALGVACLVASVWMGISADSARHAWDAALDRAFYSKTGYDAIVAARAAYYEASLRAYLLAIATCLTLLALPGLLYATRPSLLGGPVGCFLRTASAKCAPNHPKRNCPITFYQGLGWAVFGVGFSLLWLGGIAVMFFRVVWWLSFPVWLLAFSAIFMSFPLMGGFWWFTSGRR